MKKTKKQRSRTFPNIGRVSSKSITRMRRPAQKYTTIFIICMMGVQKEHMGDCGSSGVHNRATDEIYIRTIQKG